MPRVERECNFCHKTNPPPKQCSACKKAWYCTVECQKYDWVRHIFDCKPSRPITTADHLALAVNRNLMPEHEQTCIDYGFAMANRHTAIMLLGLYIGLLDPHRLGVKPYTLHKWRLAGTLVENINKEFQQLPESGRGGYYAWFLQNQDVIGREQSQQVKESPLQSEVDKWIRTAWRFIGQPPTTPMEEIQHWRQSRPKAVQDCFFLYVMLLSGSHPGPSVVIWISFAFCACESHEAEMFLSEKYLSLIRRVTFDEFCDAYQSSSLPSLFKAKGLEITETYILDVLASSSCNNSVWDLKQYVENKVINGPEDTETRPVNSVIVDYGFLNCKTTEEHKLVFDVYKAFFAMKSGANPLELHKACIEGRLFAYFAEDLGFKLRPRKTYQRLLKNPYPLPDI